MFGTVAGALTTLAFLPQVMKVIKTKDTQSLSLGMYLMQVIGVALWFIHGVSIGDNALMIANGITFCLSLVILAYKLKYK